MRTLKQASIFSYMSKEKYKETLQNKYPLVPLHMIIGTGTYKRYPIFGKYAGYNKEIMELLYETLFGNYCTKNGKEIIIRQIIDNFLTYRGQVKSKERFAYILDKLKDNTLLPLFLWANTPEGSEYWQKYNKLLFTLTQQEE